MLCIPAFSKGLEDERAFIMGHPVASCGMIFTDLHSLNYTVVVSSCRRRVRAGVLRPQSDCVVQ